MTLMTSQSMKRIQFLRWGRKRKGGPLGWCCSRSYVPKKWVNKFKAQWKKAIGWRKSSCPPQYSYDIQSYSLNFDDGGCR
ncbi:hypothetical protein LINGRAHAP2_LOCUS15191 [Linum grandiflorum]